MERKKERIMLLSLQRRQRADEARARAEAAAAARRARDEAEAERKAARKEEQARRREAILQQYKLKKAIEEAEREVSRHPITIFNNNNIFIYFIYISKCHLSFQGKVLDKSDLMEVMKHGSGAATPAGPRLRGKQAARARPKTIHVDSGALQAAEGMLGSKQPSSTNLTGTYPQLHPGKQAHNIVTPSKHSHKDLISFVNNSNKYTMHHVFW